MYVNLRIPSKAYSKPQSPVDRALQEIPTNVKAHVYEQISPTYRQRPMSIAWEYERKRLLVEFEEVHAKYKKYKHYYDRMGLSDGSRCNWTKFLAWVLLIFFYVL